MTNLQLLITCFSGILGACGVMTIFAQAWVKATRIDKIEAEIDKLWEKLVTVSVLETKIKAIEDGIRDIKEMLNK
jgi:hypothetical protein